MFDQWLYDFETGVTLLDEQVDEFATETHTPEEACEILVRMNAARENLSMVYGKVERLAREAMGEQELVVLPDGSTVEKKYSSSRTGWKHADIARVVSRRIVSSSVDFDTGEVLKTEEEMILDLLRFAGVGYWKIKELEGIGVDADQYCTKGDSKPTMTVRRNKE